MSTKSKEVDLGGMERRQMAAALAPTPPAPVVEPERAVSNIDASLERLDTLDATQAAEIGAGIDVYRQDLERRYKARLEAARAERVQLLLQEGPRVKKLLEREWRQIGLQYRLTVEVEQILQQVQETQALLTDATDQGILTMIAGLTPEHIQSGKVARIPESADIACAHPRDIRERLARIEHLLQVITEEMEHREPAHLYGDAPPRPAGQATQAETDFKVR